MLQFDSQRPVAYHDDDGASAFDLSAATYDRILSAKTASLFGFAAGAGARLGGAGEAEAASLVQFGERLGVAF